MLITVKRGRHGVILSRGDHAFLLTSRDEAEALAWSIRYAASLAWPDHLECPQRYPAAQALIDAAKRTESQEDGA